MAIYLGRHFGIDDRLIADALRTIEPADLRGHNGKARRHFIVDCYNANPSSMKSGIELLTDVAAAAPRWPSWATCWSLGNFPRGSRELGARLVRAGVRAIVAVGSFASNVAKARARRECGKRTSISRRTAGRRLRRSRKRPRRCRAFKRVEGVHLETVFEGFSKEGRNAMHLPIDYMPGKVSILGAARSGLAAAQFLEAKGVRVSSAIPARGATCGDARFERCTGFPMKPAGTR